MSKVQELSQSISKLSKDLESTIKSLESNISNNLDSLTVDNKISLYKSVNGNISSKLKKSRRSIKHIEVISDVK